MMISLIAAMSKNRVIGKGNKLPWDMPQDLKFFREKTRGKPVIMGRKTHESIGRVLPNRPNIIITRDSSYKAEGCFVVTDVDSALEKAKGYEEIMVIGGGHIYSLFMDKADRIYLTLIDTEIDDGDAFFPKLGEEWKLKTIKKHEKDDKNQFDYSFLVYEK